ncbi:MAG: polysaccharide deacetylase family protein [Actinomycetota bacterium]
MSGRRLDPLILAMHAVEYVPVRDDPNRLFIAPRTLSSLVDRLKDKGYTFVTFGDMARAVALGESAGLVSLTFDDGYRNNLYELVPIVQGRGVVATVFVATGLLTKMHPDPPSRPMLTLDEVAVLHGEGVEIGCHTNTHRDLTRLDASEVTDELSTSKEALEDVTQAPVEGLAYPFGDANKETISLAKKAGFLAACRTSGRGSWSDLHDLPRQDVGNHPSAVGLELKRRDLYEPLMRFLPARVARRVYYGVQKKVL